MESAYRQSPQVYKPSVPKEKRVPVRLELLNKLKKHGKLLGSYVEGYVRCVELLSVCKKIRQRLARGTKDKLKDPEYWIEFQDDLDTASSQVSRFLALPLPRSELGDATETLKKALKEAKGAVADAIHAPEGFDYEATANTANHSIDEMWDTVVSFMWRTQAVTESQLKEVREIVVIIGELIKQEEAVPEELAKAATQLVAGYDKKLELEGAEKKAISLPGAEKVTISPASKGSAPADTRPRY